MPLTKTPPSMMDLAVEVPLTGVGRLRGASDTGDALTLVGGAANDNNRLQIRGGSHPTTPNTMTVDLGGGEALRFNAAGHRLHKPDKCGLLPPQDDSRHNILDHVYCSRRDRGLFNPAHEWPCKRPTLWRRVCVIDHHH